MNPPTFAYEQEYWNQGISLVAGVDEAGMGALAGPVVAAAVIFGPDCPLTELRDSKVISAKKREKLAQDIADHAITWAVGEASIEEITKLNIRRASHLAMLRAIAQLKPTPILLLIDGTPAQPSPDIPAVSIVDGDALSCSIAAASILAKVHRDQIMATLDTVFPQYGFAGHKGYGSSTHMAALQEFGACPQHRPTYAPVAAVLGKH